METPLRKAPQLLLDEEQWRDFVALFPTEEIAIDRLGRPPSLTGYFTADDAPLPQPDETGWEIMEASYRLGNDLIGEFKKKLIAGEFLATGCPFPSGERTDIKPELWDRLWPNFINDCALGNMSGFSEVRLRRNPRRPALNAERLARLTHWLTKRKEKGQDSRKILLKEAQDYFTGEFRTRTFGAAYGKVFKKAKGRPRRPE